MFATRMIAGTATATMIALGGLALSDAEAQATSWHEMETMICQAIDLKPTATGVRQIINAGAIGVSNGNYTVEQFGQAVIDAVTYQCPEYYGLVIRTVTKDQAPDTRRTLA